MTRTTKECVAEAIANHERVAAATYGTRPGYQTQVERDVLNGIVHAAMMAVTGKSYAPYADHNLVLAIRATEAQLAAAKREIAHLVNVAADAYVAKRRDGWEKGPTEAEADAAVVSACANHGVDPWERLAALRGEPWPPIASLFPELEVA